MRAVFLNQRDLLIMRGARPAAALRWVGDGGSGVPQGGRRPHCGEFGLRVGRPRSREYGTDFVVDRCQHSCGAASAGGVATGGDAALDVGGTQRLEVYRERFETAHPHASCCYRSISPILSGSRAKFVDLIDFVAAHRLEPVVSGVYDGLGIPGDRQFTGGEHFGK
jgi:hypothetical protein